MSAAGIDAASQERFLDIFGLEKCIENMQSLNQAIENGATIKNKAAWLNKAMQKSKSNLKLAECFYSQ